MRKKIDAILLAVALFCISGAVLAYNITIADGEIAVSLSDLANYNRQTESAMSVYSRNLINNNLTKGDDSAVPAAAEAGLIRSYELLEPIIKNPSE